MKKTATLLLLLITLSTTCLFDVNSALATPTPWATKASMQVPRASLGAAVVEGKIYAIGGVTDPPSWVQCINTNEKYDPAADKWVFKASMPTPRASFATAVYNNKIYCIGGTTGAKEGQYAASGVNEVYDPATDTWATKSAMPTPRVGVTASVVDDKIYLFGGNSNATEVYDPEKDTWATKAAMPVAPGLSLIWSCTSAVVAGRIHVFGAFPYSSSHQVYNPETDNWTVEAPLIMGYYLAVAGSTSAPGQIYVFGVDSTWWDIGPPNFTSASYDSLGNRWRVCSMMPTPRVNVAVAVVDDLVYVIGGSVVMIENNAHPAALNEQYNPKLEQTTDTQAPEITLLSPESKTYSSSVQVDFKVNKLVTMVRFGVDAQKLITASGNSTLNLQPGIHNITVYAIDIYGNVGSSQTVAFHVADNQPFPTTLIIIAASVAAACVVLALGFFKMKSKRKSA